MKILLITIYLLFTTSGIILVKLGGDSLSLSFKNGFDFKIGFLTFFGFVFYALSFLIWQRLLITTDISYIVPLTTGIVHVAILVAAIFIFRESVNVFNILGFVFVIVGIILISLNRSL